jgi:hypothetical protein
VAQKLNRPAPPPDTGSTVRDEQAGAWKRALGNQDPGGEEQRMETPASPPPEQWVIARYAGPAAEANRSRPGKCGTALLTGVWRLHRQAEEGKEPAPWNA